MYKITAMSNQFDFATTSRFYFEENVSSSLTILSSVVDPEDDEDVEDPMPEPSKADDFEEFNLDSAEGTTEGVKNPG